MVFALVLAVVAQNPCVENNRQLVRQHLDGALTELRAVGPASFTASQWELRQQAIARLDAYTKAERYPQNLHSLRRTPLFIDEFGTRCAMAHLIEQTGALTFVERIHRERNDARIAQLADEPELLAWLTENGLSMQEAARIQPAYPSCGSLQAGLMARLSKPMAEVIVVAGPDAGIALGRVLRTFGAGPYFNIRPDFACQMPPPIGSVIQLWEPHPPPGQPADGVAWPTLTVGSHLAVSLGDRSLGYPMNDAGEVASVTDVFCVERPTLPLEAAIALANAECPAAAFVDAGFDDTSCGVLEPYSPTYSPISVREVQRCGRDGGPTEFGEPLPYRTVAWLTACRVHAGDVCSDVVDSGALDAGISNQPDGGVSVDGGTVPGAANSPPNGCAGCGSGSGALLLVLAGLLSRRRRFTSTLL